MTTTDDFDIPEAQRYFYVVYMFGSRPISGQGTIFMNIQCSDFPIKGTKKWIEENCKLDNVIILSWVEISKEQYDENPN